MSEPLVEQRLIEAFAAVRADVIEHPDLFARVTRSLAEARARRRFRAELAAGITCFVLANAALALVFLDRQEGSTTMPWWTIELITNIVLIAIAIALGPFIKRFGRSYAADVFHANPRTGKSYLVLTDVAYYLIFTAFIMFTVTFVEPADWREATGNQLKHELARVGGILLVMGILHAANVLALPVIGSLLSNNRRLGRAQRPGESTVATPPLGPGTWVLRIEPAPSSPPSGAERDPDG